MTHYQGGGKKKNQSTSILPVESLLRQIPSAHPAANQLQLLLHHLHSHSRIRPSYIGAVTNAVQISGWMTTSSADTVTTSLKAMAVVFYIYIKKDGWKPQGNLKSNPHPPPPTVGLGSPCGLPRSCDRKINSSVACDWGLALRQVSRSVQWAGITSAHSAVSHLHGRLRCPHHVGHWMNAERLAGVGPFTRFRITSETAKFSVMV